MTPSIVELPVIAAQTGALLILLQAVLMITAGLHRAKGGIFLGINGDIELERKVRRHGNLAENAAIFTIVLALAEMLGLSKTALGALAIAFVVARMFHALAFASTAGSHGTPAPGIFGPLRLLGAMGTFATSVALGGYLAWAVFL